MSAALTAAQALSDYGAGRSDAEAAWKLCLLRDKLRRTRRTNTERHLARAAAAQRQDDADASTSSSEVVEQARGEEVLQPDAVLWPSSLQARPAMAWPAALEEGRWRFTDAASGPMSVFRHQTRCTAPPASDPFFHFDDMDLAEQLCHAFLRSVLQAWRGCVAADPEDI